MACLNFASWTFTFNCQPGLAVFLSSPFHVASQLYSLHSHRRASTNWYCRNLPFSLVLVLVLLFFVLLPLIYFLISDEINDKMFAIQEYFLLLKWSNVKKKKLNLHRLGGRIRVRLDFSFLQFCCWFDLFDDTFGENFISFFLTRKVDAMSTSMTTVMTEWRTWFLLNILFTWALFLLTYCQSWAPAFFQFTFHVIKCHFSKDTNRLKFSLLRQQHTHTHRNLLPVLFTVA